MGYSPGFLLKIGRFRTLANSQRNLYKQAQKQLEIHLQACRRRFREFGTISRTYQNPPSSKPWAIAQAFCSKSVDFGHLRILTESLQTSPKTVRNPFASMQATFQRVWDDFSTYQNPPSSKPWAIAQAFCSKSVDFGHLRILTESLQTSPKTVRNPFASMQATFQRVWDDFSNYQNPPSSKPWAIAQAFCSKSVDFGHLRILTESLPTCSKIVGNQLSSMQATFQRVWDDFSHLPKSAIFKTMGYSPGFLLKIGRFRTLANSHGIFTNKPKNS